MRIAVHGASGFTGRLVVAEVRRRGITPVLVGRTGERLRKAAAEAGAAEAEIRVASLDDPTALAAAFRDCDAVVNCAGPFTLWGEPVVRAAIAADCHYVDTTGEQRYIKRILDTFGKDAELAGVTAVPAMADDGCPGDLIAHLTAGGIAPADEVLIADMRLPGVASRGTARSMAAVFADVPLDYTDGAWHPAERPTRTSLAAPGAPEEIPVAPFPLPGVVTIPRHVRARRVRSVIRSDVAALFASLTPDIVDDVPEVPDEDARRAGRWLMLAEATDSDGRRARGWATGTDVYGITTVIAVEGARRLAAGGVPAGALTPAQAFDPADFLDFLVPHGVAWEVAGPKA